MKTGVAFGWAALPPLCAAWAFAALPPVRSGGAAAALATFGALAAALSGVASGVRTDCGRRRAVVAAAVLAVAAGSAGAATARMGGSPWTGALVALAWGGALATTAALIDAFGGPGSGALPAALVAAASLTTPWWFPSVQTFLPDAVVTLNPWLVVCGHAGVDWVRSPGLYPVVGAAYTPAVGAESAVSLYAVWTFAAGVPIAAIRLHRRCRGGVRS